MTNLVFNIEQPFETQVGELEVGESFLYGGRLFIVTTMCNPETTYCCQLSTGNMQEIHDSIYVRPVDINIEVGEFLNDN